jgi:hypothetical protein
MMGYNNNIENQATRIVSNTKQSSKDCIIKGMILNFLNAADRPLRAREIFDSIQYDNYDSFRVLLSRYSTNKYKYIEKIKHSTNSHYLYQISALGRLHAANPFLHRERYKARQAEQKQMFLMELLQNPEQLNNYFETLPEVQVQTVYDTVREYVDTNSLRDFGDEDDTHESVDDDEIDYEEKYYDLQEKIKKLQSENFNLQVRLTQKPTEAPKVPENKLPSTSKSKRYNLLKDWEGKQLTAAFFASELIPFDVLVKVANNDAIQGWKQKFNITSEDNVGIFARTISSTLLKEKVYRKATPDEIKDAGLYLNKNRGIRVLSKKYPSINKVLLKKSEIPNTTPVSKKTQQHRTVINNNRK